MTHVVAVFFGVELRLACVQRGFGTSTKLGGGGTYGEASVVLDVAQGCFDVGNREGFDAVPV